MGIEKYFHVLKNSRILENIPEKDYINALKYLRATIRRFRKGEILLHIGSEVRHSGLVLEGVIECAYQDSDFNKYNMNHFTAGELFAETLALSGVNDSPMHISALTECAVMLLDFSVLCDENARYENAMQIAVNLLRIISAKNFFMNQKVRILSRKDLRRKIIAYLQSLAPDINGKRKLPFSKTALSEFLCVNRTALSRELRNMIHDGIISMNGRDFILLKQ